MSSLNPLFYQELLTDIEGCSTQTVTGDEELKKVIVSGKEFNLSDKILEKLPYFAALTSGRFAESQAEGEAIHTDEFDPNLLQVIIDYLEDEKLYKLFGHLPKEQSIFELLQLFDYLALPPPITTDVAKIQEFLLKPNYLSCNTQEDLPKLGFALFYAFGKVDWKGQGKKYRNAAHKKIMHIFNYPCEKFQNLSKFHLKQLSLKCVTFCWSQYQEIRTFSIPNDSLQTKDYEVCQNVYSSDENDSDNDNDYFGMCDFDELMGDEDLIDLFTGLYCYDSDSSGDDFFGSKWMKYNYYNDSDSSF